MCEMYRCIDIDVLVRETREVEVKFSLNLETDVYTFSSDCERVHV